MNNSPRIRLGSWRLVALLAAVGCGHTDGFTTGANPSTGPLVPGTDVRLTYNAEQDYWPAWTEDSSGVLYAYVPEGRADHDRCVGLINPLGGERLWELCDNQVGHADSTDSFTAFALGRDGRLLYQEVSAKLHAEVPTTNALWLADSAQPFARRKLITFPIQLSGTNVDWLADIAWTGPASFIALALEYVPVPHCLCGLDDSAFVGKFVVRGTINASGAQLTPIAGTEGANSYALAEGGNSIVFGDRVSNALHGVSANGGSAVTLGSVGSQSAVTGISCRLLTCAVATNQIVVLPSTPGIFPDLSKPSGRLYRFDISTGVSTLRRSGDTVANTGMFASPLITPNGTDLIVQSGGVAGHLQTASSRFGDLFLYKGILP